MVVGLYGNDYIEYFSVYVANFHVMLVVNSFINISMFKIINSLLNSWSGLIWAFKNDKSVRYELILLALSLAILFFVKIAILKKVLILLSLLFVIAVELINTALEKLADRITTNFDESIKYSKDVASAAVLIAILIMSVVLVCCIFC